MLIGDGTAANESIFSADPGYQPLLKQIVKCRVLYIRRSGVLPLNQLLLRSCLQGDKHDESCRTDEFHSLFSIRKVFEEVTRREKLGEKVIHLEIGRPDYDTPLHIKEGSEEGDRTREKSTMPRTTAFQN